MGREPVTSEAEDVARYKACLAMARGEFAQGLVLARKMREEFGAHAFGLGVQVVGAVGMGDISVFDETVNAIRARPALGGIAQIFLQLFLGEQRNLPGWFEQFDFRHLPLHERLGSGCLGVRLLFIRGEWRAVHAGAATLLNFCEQNPLTDLFQTWLHLACAISQENLGALEVAFERYRQSVRLAQALDVTLPFLDQPLGPRTLLERALTVEAPELLAKIHRQSLGYFQNLQKFRNRFTGERREVMLSPREAQLAHLLVAEYGYKQIAERMGISFPRVRNLISVLYEKLGIHHRADIARRVW